MTTIERAAGSPRHDQQDGEQPGQEEPLRGSMDTLVERAALRLGPAARARRTPDPAREPLPSHGAPPPSRAEPPAAAPSGIPLQATAAPQVMPPPRRLGPRAAAAAAPEQEPVADRPTAEAGPGAGPAAPPPPEDRTPAMIDLGRLEAKGFVSPSKPTTRVAEEFRLVKRPLLRNAFTEPSNGAASNKNVLMVTSSAPREGKTFIATNLAISMASERDVFVLLIDADVAQPGIFATLGLDEGPGLTDLLADPTLDPGHVIHPTSIEKLSVMSAGTPHSLASELLASQRMRQIVEEVATRYRDRIIIFDSPPLLARSEPSVLAHCVGQIVFVVEADRTSESEVRAAMDLIDDCENVSVVLNRSSSLFMQSSFGQYFSKYDIGRKKSHEKR
jgi:receptor protein-tyrosine kinase